MRPIDKGPAPLKEDDTPFQPGDYREWRKRLIERIGYYCVYCNQPLSHNLQIEHVIPQNPPAGYEAGDLIAWENMLLACGPCNNAKGNTPVTSSNYYFPDQHNTLLPFETITDEHEHALVAARNTLAPSQHVKAANTIQLFRLDSVDDRDAVVDIRSSRRYDALLAVMACRKQFDNAKHAPAFQMEDAAHAIVLQANAIGFFSLWYEAFQDEPEVMRRLISIRGTARNCFDEQNGYRVRFRNPDDPVDQI